LGFLVYGLTRQPVRTAGTAQVKPVRSELVYMLVGLDKQYTAEDPAEPWESYYACRLLDYFGHPLAEANLHTSQS
jgi:hypothetical protein